MDPATGTAVLEGSKVASGAASGAASGGGAGGAGAGVAGSGSGQGVGAAGGGGGAGRGPGGGAGRGPGGGAGRRPNGGSGGKGGGSGKGAAVAKVAVGAGAAAATGGASAAAGGAAAGGASGGAAAGGASGGGAGGLGQLAQLGSFAGSGGGGQGQSQSQGQNGGTQIQAENGSRAMAVLLGLVAFLGLLPLILICVCVGVVATLLASLNPLGGGGGSSDADFGLRWPTGTGIPAVYQPMYEAASLQYGVNQFLLAAIHKQETDFSRNPAARSGTNSSGAAGPMQFLLSTWVSHDKAFAPIDGNRPDGYPLDRSKLPSCRGVPESLGCVYDDFDAIAGAAQKLKADGATMDLDAPGTRRAVCAYIGSCGEVDKCTGSKNEYCEVLPRARKWQLMAGTLDTLETDAGKAVAWALTMAGITELPKGSNCGGPIDAWQRRAGAVCGTPWCGVFVHEAYLHAGIDLPSWIASVPTTYNMAKEGGNGLKLIPTSQIKQGDIVIFQWDVGVPDHMGLAAADYDGAGRLATIEGNTSDGVHRRLESPDAIYGVARVVKGA